ncbi:MAG TPA: terminase family protein [Sphingomonas sp.]|nr:terminase family protein [Sphingomonas sp.]
MSDKWKAVLAAAAEGVASERDWFRFAKHLPAPVRRELLFDWTWQAHGGQVAPAARAGADARNWRVWLLMAGRGFGKTRAGAEWVLSQARAMPGARIALVGASVDETVKVMVEGPSGLLALARFDEPPEWVRTRGLVRFGNGSEAVVYSAGAREKLRGPEHHFAWADELAKWRRPERAWHNLMMGLRLGEDPRAVVTTTPRPVAIVRELRAMPGTVETRGRTAENLHLAGSVRDWLVETYGGTRLGRQELDGELFDDVAGALWTRDLLDLARSDRAPAMKRVVVGVDPPASAEGDACGIVVCGLGADGLAYVLADRSVSGLRPEGWAKAVARAAEAWGADRVIAEKNQGGDMVGSVLAGIDAGLPVRLVSATRGKAARAEPIAARFENGRAKLAGRFPELEDELAGLTAGGGYQGPGRSPDRADAMVWAMTELTRPTGEPRVLTL